MKDFKYLGPIVQENKNCGQKAQYRQSKVDKEKFICDQKAKVNVRIYKKVVRSAFLWFGDSDIDEKKGKKNWK